MADSKRARSWKRRTQPRIDLINAEPVLYSTFYLTFLPNFRTDRRGETLVSTHAEKLLTWLQRPVLVARGPPVAPSQLDTLAVY
jgi:hypothetical protein